MATTPVTLQIASIGADAGPFIISDNVQGVLAMGVTRAQMLAGYTVNVDTMATLATATSTGVCTTSINFTLNPAPTPAPTPTPTPAPTPTPVPAFQALFDPNYTSNANVCGDGGRVWSRLTGPSGSTVQLTLSVIQGITNVSGSVACIEGVLYETTLPSSYPTPGTMISGVSGSIGSAFVPYFVSDTDTVNVTIPASGYKDVMLVYKTNHLTSNFTNGNFTVQITQYNGTSVSGDLLSTNYLCSDSGPCTY